MAGSTEVLVNAIGEQSFRQAQQRRQRERRDENDQLDRSSDQTQTESAAPDEAVLGQSASPPR